jgi:class 3 adenylate cyclase/tetratricopeptide (TPR) repeat protein
MSSLHFRYKTMGSLDAYIPIDRRLAIARGETLPDRARGAVLFADISGFTNLTEKLVRQLGPQRGAEELTRQLNAVYGTLIAEIHDYHGSVIGFSGDAITCWYDGDDGRQATACALAIQDFLSGFGLAPAARTTRKPFSLKVAVAAGHARRFLVGDPDIQSIEALAGSLLDRVAAAEKLAGQGEIVASAEIPASLGAEVEVSEWRTDSQGQRFAVIAGLRGDVATHPWPEAPDLDPDVARQWLLPPVFERLQRGEGEFLSELRPAVALFLRFSGINYDGDDDSGQKLDRYLRWAQSVLARHEGFLLQLTIGDKGSYYYAAFGAPLAHENQLNRALAAALVLCSPPADFNYLGQAQIGISQGQMRAGAYGSRTRRIYGVHGPHTNLAARLMSTAEPGQIVVTGTVAKAMAGDYTFQELGQVPLKGVAEPVTLYALQGGQRLQVATEMLSQQTHKAMVGRAREKALLSEGLRALQETGQSQLIFIQGEAGIGKSRLAADVLEQAKTAGLAYWVGGGEAIERATAYHAWRPIIGQLFSLDGLAEGLDESRRRTAQERVLARLEEVDPALVALAPLLNAVLPLDLPESEATAGLSGDTRANETHELLVNLIGRATADKPRLLVIEDAHWLDSASWVLLRLVTREAPALLAILTMRPFHGPPPEDYVRLRNRPESQVIVLDSLAPDEIIALVSQRLGADHLPAAVADFIQERAAGHPYFSEELAYALRDGGLIQVSDGQVQITTEAGDLRRLDFPDTIEGVIISRIDRLPTQQQLALKVASVIGRIFAFRVLRDIHPVEQDKPALREYLEDLQRLDITLLEATDPDLTYLFKHMITQEVTYNLLLFAQRRELHQTVARWYETVYGEDLSPFYPLLVHHWRSAEDRPRTLEYLGKAGEQAARIGANQETISFLSEALALNETERLVTDKRVLARWEHQLGFAHLTLGHIEQSIAHFQAALGYLGRHVRPSTGGQILGLLGGIGRQILHRLWPGRFLGVAPDPDVSLTASHIFQDLATAVFHLSDPIGAMYATINQLNAAEQAPRSGMLAPAYAAAGVLTGLIAPHRLSPTYVRLAEEVLPEASPAEKGYALELLGMYWMGLGRWDKASPLGEEALRIFDQSGHYRRWQEQLVFVSLTLMPQGEVERARQLRMQLRELATRSASVHGQTWSLVLLAEIALLEDDLDEAIAYLEEATAISSVIGHTDRIWVYGVLAVARLRAQQPDLARQAATAAQALIDESMPDAFYALEGYSGVAEAGVMLWNPETESGKAARKSLKGIKQFANFFPVGKPRALLWEGVYHCRRGRPVKGLKLWRKGLSLARELALRYEEGLICWQIATNLPGDDPARLDYLRRAAELFADLGASRNAALVRQTLADEAGQE